MTGRGSRRWPTRLGGGLGILAAGLAIGWAVSTVLTPAADPLEATDHTYAEVTPGEVGESIRLNTAAEWSLVPEGTNQATGVVTAVIVHAGDEVGQGSVLYRVDERPVVAARGTVPAYRAIAEGARGEDVAQVQRMLAELGFAPGAADGVAGAATTRAIQAWQRSQGLEETGVVEPGDIVFLTTVPTRVSLDSKIVARGAAVSGGEVVVNALPAAPAFAVPVTEAQARAIPVGTGVEITAPEGGTWPATVVDHVTDDDTGTVDVILQGPDGTAVCADQCGQIPVTGETLLASRIVTVAPVSGLVVPSAALVTDARGQVAVIDDRGRRIDVTVLASARGMSVVEGVTDGTRVRVPASEGER